MRMGSNRPRLELEPLGQAAKASLDRLGRMGSRFSSSSSAAARTGSEPSTSGIDLDVSEEEACEVRKLPSFAIFWTSGAAARTVPRPNPGLARGDRRAARPRTPGAREAQVDAVQPVELRVVERGRARTDALEREALDQLVAAHDRRLVVVAPAEEGQEVDEGVRKVALPPKLLRRDRAVSLGASFRRRQGCWRSVRTRATALRAPPRCGSASACSRCGRRPAGHA